MGNGMPGSIQLGQPHSGKHRQLSGLRKTPAVSHDILLPCVNISGFFTQESRFKFSLHCPIQEAHNHSDGVCVLH